MPDAYPVLLSGPPASGKSSITAALVRYDPSFVLVRKVKDSFQGRQDDYDIVSQGDFDRLIHDGQLLQWNARYGRRYGVSTASVCDILEQGQCPVIHLGRYETLIPLRAALPGSVSVLLWSPPEVLASRLAARSPGDPREVENRLSAFREERDDLLAITKPEFDIVFENTSADASMAAIELLTRLRDWNSSGRPRNRDALLALQLAGNSVVSSKSLLSGLNKLTFT